MSFRPHGFHPHRLFAEATVWALNGDHAEERMRRGLQRVNAENIRITMTDAAPGAKEPGALPTAGA